MIFIYFDKLGIITHRASAIDYTGLRFWAADKFQNDLGSFLDADCWINKCNVIAELRRGVQGN